MRYHFTTLKRESPHVLKVVTFSPRLGKWAGFFSWGDFRIGIAHALTHARLHRLSVACIDIVLILILLIY